MPCSQTRHQNPLSGPHDQGNAGRKGGRELASSSDWDAAFRPLPTILLANVQSLDNKLCELRARISYQRETRDCCVICLTETWMSAMVPDSAIELTGFSVYRSDRTKELTGKSRGGGVCFYINNSWCDERNIHSIKSFCSPDLEFHMLLCRPFWLPREFTEIIITAVYIPPQANTDQALKELYRNISEQETTHPDAAFIITGDFNKANFRTIAPKYFQHITINTRGDRVLDHCYSPFRDAFKSLPRIPFSKSDHSSVLHLPAYRQKLKCEAPALRIIQCWSDQSDLFALLQYRFDHVDWDMFWAVSDDDIEAYSDSVTCFIRKCIEDVVPTKTIHIYPNQKPWINSDVRPALSARTSAFKSGNTDDRKQASYDLRRSIKAAKGQYKNKVEEKFNNNNARSMWQGINNITGFKGNKQATVNIAASLPDELNTFYARFEADNTAHTESAYTAAAEEVSPLSLSIADVTRSFKRVNIRKAVGPDGIPGRVLKACAFQLAGVLQTFSICSSLCLWFPHSSKNPPLCPYRRKIKLHAWMTGGPLLSPPSSASVLRDSSETTSALCCLLHWTHYNLHTAVTVPQTMLLPSPCTLLSPTWKIKTPMWGCCSWIIVQHLTP